MLTAAACSLSACTFFTLGRILFSFFDILLHVVYRPINLLSVVFFFVILLNLYLTSLVPMRYKYLLSRVKPGQDSSRVGVTITTMKQQCTMIRQTIKHRNIVKYTRLKQAWTIQDRTSYKGSASVERVYFLRSPARSNSPDQTRHPNFVVMCLINRLLANLLGLSATLRRPCTCKKEASWATGHDLKK